MTLWNAPSSKNRKQAEAFTVGKDPELDLVLLPYDIAGSKAHVTVLEQAGILTREEGAALQEELDAILASWQAGDFAVTVEQEDCHTAIEEWLTEQLGSLGKKIHTGRSRNDQVATAIALYMQEQLGMLERELAGGFEALQHFAAQHEKVALPGYTHQQQAMLSTVELWARSYAEMLEQDLAFATSVKCLLDKSPLGSAAGYGPSITLDRELGASELGLNGLIRTAPAAQGLRGKNEALAVTACQQAMATLAKLATDLLLFTMQEIGYMTLAPEHCTGSSIMPQKRNGDVLELVRAKAGVVTATLGEVNAIAASLPSGYNRDFQLLKEPLFRAFQETLASCSMATAVIGGVHVEEEAILAKLSPQIVAADKATTLAAQGVPFRDAYRQVQEELASLRLSKEEVAAHIASKRTIGAPGNP